MLDDWTILFLANYVYNIIAYCMRMNWFFSIVCSCSPSDLWRCTSNPKSAIIVVA